MSQLAEREPGSSLRPAAPPAKGLRSCRRADLPAVAALYESVVRSGKRAPPPRLAEYFERTFFDYPWADAQLPSLVYEDPDGRVVGFLGSHVRRLRLGTQVIRVAYGGQLVVDPQARSRAVGAILFRTHLQGPQDATVTDGANETVRGMWALCGGETSHLKTITWTRVLRPVRFAADAVVERLQRPALARRLRPLWQPLDRAVLGLAGRRLRPPAPETGTETLTPRNLLEHLPAVTAGVRCHPDYDEPYLSWLFHEMAQVKSRGTLVRSLVRNSRGQFIGWYVYYLQGGLSQVLQVAATHGATEAVLDDLLHHAYVNGAAAVHGRLEPQLLGALSRRKCLFGWSGGALIQARNPALLGVLLSSRSWFGRMDGEWWMGHHTEAFS